MNFKGNMPFKPLKPTLSSAKLIYRSCLANHSRRQPQSTPAKSKLLRIANQPNYLQLNLVRFDSADSFSMCFS
ncbi:hypothetical protein Ae201684_011393 [Aphanomyces euteiches]|uniref:Uncharacterized protein n=1 Tax=Aphanomyces euteiches TaxID=100861 RepID=A0A6G0WUY2_9STRA|nr:hypothetical protein Ae201684_011393 [Aphanomyces euteiches]